MIPEGSQILFKHVAKTTGDFEVVGRVYAYSADSHSVPVEIISAHGHPNYSVGEVTTWDYPYYSQGYDHEGEWYIMTLVSQIECPECDQSFLLDEDYVCESCRARLAQ